MSESIMPDPIPPSLPPLGNTGWRQAHDKVLTPNYGPRRLAIVRGQGTRVWDADGKEYLDFLTGISVNNLGHCHPRVTQAIAKQAATLVHCSNLYYIPVQIELARMLVENCFADRVFFGNSGAEANEAAIKIARRWMRENNGEGRHEIVTMRESFHGRTMATLAATGQAKVQKHFDPLLQGFHYAPFNDLAGVEEAISERTGAILVEPIQGEGGVVPATEEFLRGLRRLCDERGLLLIFDEVQCGLGRAGSLFAHQAYGVEPDIMTLAKSLGGGMAMGAMLCTERISSAFGVGAHASTMGGNPIASAAGLAYLSEMIEGGWPAHAVEMGEYLVAELTRATDETGNVKEFRARGLMIGMEVHQGGGEIVTACEEAGLLLNLTAGQTVRFLPPLNVLEAEIDRAVKIVAQAMRNL